MPVIIQYYSENYVTITRYNGKNSLCSAVSVRFTDRYVFIACSSIVSHLQYKTMEWDTMTEEIDVTETLDVKGESCPMPVVKAKQTIDTLSEDEVLEVLSTDSGSMSDIAGWASGTDGVRLLDQAEGDGLYRHYVEKTG